MRIYRKGKSGLYLPQINYLEVGIDDAGIRQENLLGWSIILFDEFSSTELNSKHKKILDNSGISEFHGREFKNTYSQRNAYKEFFEAIYEIGKRANFFYVKYILYPRDKYESELKEVINLAKKIKQEFQKEDYGGKIRIPDSLKDVLKFFIPPLRQLLTDLECTEKYPKIRFFFDNSKNIVKLLEEKAFLYKLLTSNKEWIALIINYMLKISKNYKSRCRIESDLIYPVEAKECYIVQAADIVANFGLNFLRYILRGKPVENSTQCIKYKIFKETLLKETDLNELEERLKNCLFVNEKREILASGGRDICVFSISQMT